MTNNKFINDNAVNISERGDSMVAGEDSANWYSKTRHFASVLENKSALAVFLSIMKNDFRMADDLMSDTGLTEPDELFLVIRELRESGLICENPNPATVSKKYILDFNGKLFADFLMETKSSVKAYVGEKNFIEPIEVPSET